MSDANGSVEGSFLVYFKIKLSLLVRLARCRQYESRRRLDSMMFQGGDIQEGLRTTLGVFNQYSHS